MICQEQKGGQYLYGGKMIKVIERLKIPWYILKLVAVVDGI